VPFELVSAKGSESCASRRFSIIPEVAASMQVNLSYDREGVNRNGNWTVKAVAFRERQTQKITCYSPANLSKLLRTALRPRRNRTSECAD
jgi:hypothetical protein